MAPKFQVGATDLGRQWWIYFKKPKPATKKYDDTIDKNTQEALTVIIHNAPIARGEKEAYVWLHIWELDGQRHSTEPGSSVPKVLIENEKYGGKDDLIATFLGKVIKTGDDAKDRKYYFEPEKLKLKGGEKEA